MCKRPLAESKQLEFYDDARRSLYLGEKENREYDLQIEYSNTKTPFQMTRFLPFQRVIQISNPRKPLKSLIKVNLGLPRVSCQT